MSFTISINISKCNCLMADDEQESPKRIRLSIAGAATYGTKFKETWMNEFPFVTEGHQDPMYNFHCKICKKDISCRHQGIADVRRHERSKSHIDNVAAVKTTSCLKSLGFVTVHRSAIDKQVNPIASTVCNNA